MILITIFRWSFKQTYNWRGPILWGIRRLLSNKGDGTSNNFGHFELGLL